MTQTPTARSTYDAIKPREQLFVDEYVKSMNQKEAGIAAGYKPSTASISAYQLMKRPQVALAIAKALEEKSMLARIDASWVLKRLARLADFSIKNFIVVDDNTGRLYYDFASATDDDWYCINEITIGAIRARHRAAMNDDNEGRIAVDQVKIKTGDKMKALELVGKHVDVQAFKDKAGASDMPVTEVTRTVVRAKVTGPPGSPTLPAPQTAGLPGPKQ